MERDVLDGTDGGRLAQLNSIISSLSPPVTPASADCLRRLLSFQSAPCATPYPASRLAGVLILLHINPVGKLSVTLTTRSMKLRSHPGDTALPGGRFEEGDASIEYTALREANEEIGLPLDESPLFHLTNLPAFTARNLLAVIPTIYLLTTQAPPILSSLIANPSEVSAIFHLPLYSFLGKKRPSSSSSVIVGDEILHHHSEDFEWLGGTLYRFHQFTHPTIPSPVAGLTADILIMTACIGYYGMKEDGEEVGTGFERRAEGQMSWGGILGIAMRCEGVVRLGEKVKGK